MGPIALLYATSAALGGGWLAVSWVLHAAGSDHEVHGHGVSGKEIGGKEIGGKDVAGRGPTFHPHGEPAISWVSPLVLSVALFGFGVLGLSGASLVDPDVFSLPIALLGGGGAGAILRRSLGALKGVEVSSHGHRAALVGIVAQVSVGIPPGGVGEIDFVQAGARVTGPARGRDGVAIPTGSSVFISGVDGHLFEVEEEATQRASRSPPPPGDS